MRRVRSVCYASGDLGEHLVGAGRGRGDILEVLKLVHSSVPGELHGRHPFWNILAHSVFPSALADALPRSAASQPLPMLDDCAGGSKAL